MIFVMVMVINVHSRDIGHGHSLVMVSFLCTCAKLWLGANITRRPFVFFMTVFTQVKQLANQAKGTLLGKCLG